MARHTWKTDNLVWRCSECGAFIYSVTEPLIENSEVFYGKYIKNGYIQDF